MDEEIKISQLEEATEINENDLTMIVQNGVNKKAEIKQIVEASNTVVVGPTEPTGADREKVWIRRGKNRFNKNETKYLNNTYLTSNKSIGETLTVKTYYIECEPNTTYTISKKAGKYFRFASSTNAPSKNGTVTVIVINDTGKVLTITTGPNDKYILFNIHNSSSDTETEQEILNSVQIEQNPTATEHEDYIENKIYVKNDNDVYEEFSNIDEINTLIQDIISREFKLVDRDESTNYNDYIKNGFYQCNFQNGINAPDAYSTGMLIVFGNYYIAQLFIGSLNNSTSVFARFSGNRGETWTAWTKLT